MDLDLVLDPSASSSRFSFLFSHCKNRSVSTYTILEIEIGKHRSFIVLKNDFSSEIPPSLHFMDEENGFRLLSAYFSIPHFKYSRSFYTSYFRITSQLIFELFCFFEHRKLPSKLKRTKSRGSRWIDGGPRPAGCARRRFPDRCCPQGGGQ